MAGHTHLLYGLCPLIRANSSLRAHTQSQIASMVGLASWQKRGILQLRQFSGSASCRRPSAFDPATSKFPSSSELYAALRPSRELFQCIRDWHGAISEDMQRLRPRWTREQHFVMGAACIQFEMRNWPVNMKPESFKRCLTFWALGLEADAQSQHSRWTPEERTVNLKSLFAWMEWLGPDGCAELTGGHKSASENSSTRSRGQKMSVFSKLITLYNIAYYPPLFPSHEELSRDNRPHQLRVLDADKWSLRVKRRQVAA